MTRSFDTTLPTERQAAVVKSGCVAALNSFAEGVLPVDAAPGLEFLVVFIAVDVKGLGSVLMGLGRGGDHHPLSRLKVL